MAYAIRADLERLALPARALEGLSDTPEEVDAVVTESLSGASGFIDDYLNSRYTLPLTAWGEGLKRATCLVAAYDIMVVRGYNPQFFDENLRLRYEDILKWLANVAAGKLSPDIVDSSTPEQPGVSAPLVESDPRRGW